jgi:hypothetical protein
MTTRTTASELKTFDQEAKDLIMGLEAIGCRVRVSRKGHAIIANDVGMTCSVSRNMTSPNRSAQNVRAEVKKIREAQLAHLASEQVKSKHPLTGEPQEVELTLAQALHAPGFAAALGKWMDENPSPPDTQIKVRFTDDRVLSIEALDVAEPQKEQIMAAKPTPTPKDAETFDCPHCGVVPGSKETHCKKAGHIICLEPDCDGIVKNVSGMGPHRTMHKIASGERAGWRKNALTAQEKVDAIQAIISGTGVSTEQHLKVIAERDQLLLDLTSAREDLAKAGTHGKDYDDLLAEYEKVEKERDEAVSARDELQQWKDNLRGLLK